MKIIYRLSDDDLRDVVAKYFSVTSDQVESTLVTDCNDKPDYYIEVQVEDGVSV